MQAFFWISVFQCQQNHSSRVKVSKKDQTLYLNGGSVFSNYYFFSVLLTLLFLFLCTPHFHWLKLNLFSNENQLNWIFSNVLPPPRHLIVYVLVDLTSLVVSPGGVFEATSVLKQFFPIAFDIFPKKDIFSMTNGDGMSLNRPWRSIHIAEVSMLKNETVIWKRNTSVTDLSSHFSPLGRSFVLVSITSSTFSSSLSLQVTFSESLLHWVSPQWMRLNRMGCLK